MDPSRDPSSELTTLQDDLRILQGRFRSLQGELIEIKELARGTMGTDGASRESLVAAIGLLRNDLDSYRESQVKMLLEIRRLEVIERQYKALQK